MIEIDRLRKNFISLRQEVVETLIKKNITISTCESATAGSIASNICDVSGASNVFSEAYIVYSNNAKIKILNIDEDLIKKNGVVSKECALAMAKNLYTITHSDICISITGNLGPNVLEQKPAGLVYAGYLYNGIVNVKEYRFNENRLDNKFLVVYEVFKEIEQLIR